jgi:hypothetical protein
MVVCVVEGCVGGGRRRRFVDRNGRRAKQINKDGYCIN